MREDAQTFEDDLTGLEGIVIGLLPSLDEGIKT